MYPMSPYKEENATGVGVGVGVYGTLYLQVFLWEVISRGSYRSDSSIWCDSLALGGTPSVAVFVILFLKFRIFAEDIRESP